MYQPRQEIPFRMMVVGTVVLFCSIVSFILVTVWTEPVSLAASSERPSVSFAVSEGDGFSVNVPVLIRADKDTKIGLVGKGAPRSVFANSPVLFEAGDWQVYGSRAKVQIASANGANPSVRISVHRSYLEKVESSRNIILVGVGVTLGVLGLTFVLEKTFKRKD